MSAPAQEALPLIAAHPVFSRLSEPDQRELARASLRLSFGPAHAICREGSPGDGWFLMVSGRARVSVTNARGRQEVIATLLPGAIFGVTGTVEGGPRAATVAAREHSLCLYFPASLLVPKPPQAGSGLALRLQEVLTIVLAQQLYVVNQAFFKRASLIQGQDWYTGATDGPAAPSGWILPDDDSPKLTR